MAWIRQHQRAVGVGTVVSALTLIAIAVAIGWALFSRGPETGQISPSPSVDSSSRPSVATTQSTEPEPSVAPSVYPAMAWPPQATGGTFLFGSIWAVATVNDLNIRSGPGTSNTSIGQLDMGDLALVLEGGEAPGSWAHVAADGAIGYVNTGPADNPWLKATPTPWKSYYTNVLGVASNGSSYIAFGNSEALDYSPYEGGEGALIMVSDDGTTWSTMTAGPSGTVTDVAGGPPGWIALSTGSMIPSFTNFSADGRTWEHGEFPGGNAVAYGPAGFVVLGGNQAWRSADGRSWSDPVAVSGALSDTHQAPDRLESSDAGYLAFGRGDASGTGVWASADGVKWVQADIPGDGAWIADVELFRNNVLVVLRESVGTEEVGGRSRLLRGTLAPTGAVTWSTSTVAFDEGQLVDSISQRPDGLLAMGWDIRALIPVLWSSTDGASWQRLNAAGTSLGGSVGPEPVWGVAGWVGLGTAADGGGQQLWRSTDGEEWNTGGGQIELRTRPPCPPANEVSTLVLMYLGRFAEQCFGGSSLTIRAWVPLVDGLGGCCFQVSGPGWLNGVYPAGWLMSGEASEWSTGLNAHVPPGVDGSLLKANTWVEVVGHFRDPVAATCTSTPLAMYPPDSLLSQASVRQGCLERFVLESITPVGGP
jgi:hypothetical protein